MGGICTTIESDEIPKGSAMDLKPSFTDLVSEPIEQLKVFLCCKKFRSFLSKQTRGINNKENGSEQLKKCYKLKKRKSFCHPLVVFLNHLVR